MAGVRLEEFYTEPYVATLGDDVFVTDSFNHRFARYDDGKLTGVWGKTGSGSGEFNRPIGIAAAPDGSIYVSDTMNNRIQKFEVPPVRRRSKTHHEDTGHRGSGAQLRRRCVMVSPAKIQLAVDRRARTRAAFHFSG